MSSVFSRLPFSLIHLVEIKYYLFLDPSSLNHWASLVAQLVKNLPAMQETWVRSLGWDDPLEEGMAMYSSTLAWRISTDSRAWWAAVHGGAKSWTQLNGKAQHKT